MRLKWTPFGAWMAILLATTCCMLLYFFALQLIEVAPLAGTPHVVTKQGIQKPPLP